jgi:sugar phosphate isomerase/epimerase
MRTPILAALALAFVAASWVPAANKSAADTWNRDQLIAWCIVPYDAKLRDPDARAAMLEKLGVHKFAYDWRAPHIPTFDDEVKACARHGIEIVAWWFPQKLDANAQIILDVIKRHQIHPQLWVTGGGAAVKDEAEQSKRIANEVARLRPIVEAAKPLGCTVGLYNHGGWFGQPENQLAVLKALRAEGCTNVGLVYNFHHGHDDVARFAEVWSMLKDHVLAINLNGMHVPPQGRPPEKIVEPLGTGDHELAMMRVIDRSGWRGMVGILNHRTDVDAEEGLTRNRAGFDRLVASIRAER